MINYAQQDPADYAGTLAAEEWTELSVPIPAHLWCCRRAGKSGGGGQGSLKYVQTAIGRSSQVLV